MSNTDADEQLLAAFASILREPDLKLRGQRLKAAFGQINGLLSKASFAEFVRQAWHVLEPGTNLEWNWHHQLMCDVLQAMFHAWQDSKTQRGRDNRVRAFDDYVRNAVFNVPPGSLKPVSVHGRVLEKHRGVITAGEVREGDKLLTHKGRYREVLKTAPQGELPLIKFTTRRGKVIKVAGDHPMLTQRGWVRADEITLNDVFAEIHPIEVSGSQTISNEEARLLGYLIGDGSVGRGLARFGNIDAETTEDFIRCGEQTGFHCTYRLQERNYGGTNKKPLHTVHLTEASKGCVFCRKPIKQALRTRRCSECKHKRVALNEEQRAFRDSSTVKNWLNKHGILGKKSATKRVPRAVMEGSEEVIINYLAAYWACDGTICPQNDATRANDRRYAVAATTISEGLAQDHQILLQKLGLSFMYRPEETILSKAMVKEGSPRVGDKYKRYNLIITDHDTVAKFLDILGPHIKHEKGRRTSKARTRFDQVINEDAVIKIEDAEPGECVCFQIEEDSSFVYQGVAVHNSRIIGVCFQPWCWLHEPSMRFICLSVNEDATLRDGRMSRDLIKSDWYQSTFRPLRFNLKTDQDAISNYGNTQGGDRLSKPSGSEVVGLRGDCLLIDDPNNPKEAENATERSKINELWTTNIANRVNDPRRSLRIGVQQRVHKQDWTGYVLGQDGKNRWSPDNQFGWLNIVLPAEYDPARKFVMPECLRKYCTWPGAIFEDPRTVEGQSIHIERFTDDYLKSEKERWKHTTNYSGQMQQQPAAAEGQLVQRKWWGWFRFAEGVREDIQTGDHPRPLLSHEGPAHVVHQKLYHPGEPDFDWITITVDPAAKKTDRGSAHGLLCVAGKGGKRYILDDRTQRGAFHEILDVIKDMIRTWKPDSILIEPKAAGPDLMDTLREQMMSGDVPMVSIEEAEPGNTDKEQRLGAAIPYLKNGQVYLLEGAPWLKDFLDELSEFPASDHNDRVDALSQVLNFRRVSADALPTW